MIKPNWLRACANFFAQALLVSAIFLATTTTAIRADQPSTIVLVTVGALRVDVLNQPDEFPALTTLAERSVRFSAASTPSPQSLPALTSVLTGLSPRDHGVADAYRAPLAESIETLPERLASRGWRTLAYPGDALAHSRSGLLQGFTDVDRFAPTRSFSERADSVVTALRSPDGSPTFVWLDYSEVARRPPWARVVPHGSIEPRVYRVRMREVDDAIARLVDVLENREDAMLVVTGTHGYTLAGEPGFPGSGLDLAPTALDVPLLFSRNGMAPRDVPDAVSTIDIAPTLADIAGESDVDRSLATALVGGDLSPRTIEHETDVSRLTSWPPLVATRLADGTIRVAETDPEFDATARTRSIDTIFAARELAEQRQARRAVALLDSVARIYPDNGLLFIELGLALTFTRQEKGAAPLFDMMVNRHPEWYEMKAAYMEALLRFDRNDAAISKLQNMVSSPLFESERLWSLGTFQAGSLRFDEALATYREALAVGPPTSARWHRFWQNLPLLDSYAAEIEVEKDPFIAYVEMGKLFGEVGMFNEAYRRLNFARGILLTGSVADYWIGHYLLLEGRPQHALVAFRRALENDETFAPSWSEFGTAKLELGEPDSALFAYDRAIQAGSTDPITKYNYACLLARDGRNDEAFTWLKQAVDEGYRNYEMLSFDPDLDPLRDRVEFADLLARSR